MPAEALALRAGQIVLADWRGDALPKEPNKPRPAVVVEEDGMFAPNYPNAILVPLTEDGTFAIPELSVAIAPTEEIGCSKPCWAVSHLVATMAKARLRATPSRVTADQLMWILAVVEQKTASRDSCFFVALYLTNRVAVRGVEDANGNCAEWAGWNRHHSRRHLRDISCPMENRASRYNLNSEWDVPPLTLVALSA